MHTGTTVEMARDILRYLVRHPEAEDTLEGITRWWLERERIERTVDEVHESLQLLVTRGLLMEQRGRARPACYRMNRAKGREIEEFLK
ncbi:MAG: hypothetical protein ACE5FK_02220 [Candidatus Methylomirabilia bacterium]